VSGPDRPDEEPETSLTPPVDEREPDWAERIRELRRQRAPRLEERLADDAADEERPLPDL
jgi:hypothetical protein